MLVRICGHFINNPNHIDKLIAIKGLPEEWLFRPSRFGGKELMPPWEPDVEENIPESIRHLCEPTEVTRVFPPIEKGREHVVDKTTVIGLRFNFMSQPGQELWEKIERYLDRMTPRDEKVPVPVLVAPNQQSAFAPHAARRTVRGSLELYKADIPLVDLRKPEVLAPVHAPILSVTSGSNVGVVTMTEPKADILLVPPTPQPFTPTVYECDQCNKTFMKKQALAMHKMSGHRKAAVIAAGA